MAERKCSFLCFRTFSCCSGISTSYQGVAVASNIFPSSKEGCHQRERERGMVVTDIVKIQTTRGEIKEHPRA